MIAQSDETGRRLKRPPLVGDQVTRHELAEQIVVRFAGHVRDELSPAVWAEMVEHAEASLVFSGRPVGDPSPRGRARKVSVSMPEELTAAVQERVGKGGFSHYVTEAVARQYELDLLAELAELLEDEYGPVPEELVAEAGAAWPDAD